MEKTVSLSENYLFRRLYQKGKYVIRPTLVLYVMKNKKRCNRLGITATKKIGGAVQRNRGRRVIHEAYRLLEQDLPTGLDIVIVARGPATTVKMQIVKKDLSQAFARLQSCESRKNGR